MKPNPNCDIGQCNYPDGAVKLLPYGGDANIICCYHCYLKEINFRKKRNTELADWAAFKLPTWEDLNIYEGC